MANPLYRHQDSLKDVLNLSSSPPLADDTRRQAERRFYDIVTHFENNGGSISAAGYNRPRLVRLMYEHAIARTSKDNVLQAFFRAMQLPADGPSVDLSNSDPLLERLDGFADHLIHNFFLPLKASTARTPQPTPEYRSATMRATGQGFVVVSTRLSGLRGECLTRDKHRCVISRKYDQRRARQRIQPNGQVFDDDGQLLSLGDYDHLEVAHILPHSLVETDSGSEELNEARKAALEVLNMFDNDAAHLINGVDVDRPRNALTLRHYLHQDFGRFEIYFTPSGDGPPNTYRIETFLPAQFHPDLPVTRTLYTTEDHTIEPPSARLLAIHRAIAYILHLSAAGQYIDRILRSAEEQTARCDGSTQLGELVRLGLGKLLTT